MRTSYTPLSPKVILPFPKLLNPLSSNPQQSFRRDPNWGDASQALKCIAETFAMLRLQLEPQPSILDSAVSLDACCLVYLASVLRSLSYKLADNTEARARNGRMSKIGV